jgi:hypothetical protein
MRIRILNTETFFYLFEIEVYLDLYLWAYFLVKLGQDSVSWQCIAAYGTGNACMFQRIVAGNKESVKSRDNRGWQPLHEAAHHGHANCVRYWSDTGTGTDNELWVLEVLTIACYCK